MQIDDKEETVEHSHLQYSYLCDGDDSDKKITTSFLFITTDYNTNQHNEICHTQEKSIAKSWIILDNGSTVDIFPNKDLLTNIRSTKTIMNVRCNARVTKTNLQSDLKGYGKVWYNPQGIANILSLSHVQEKNRITFDRNVDGRNPFFTFLTQMIW